MRDMSGVPGMQINRRRVHGSCVCPTCGGAGSVAHAPPSIARVNDQYLSKWPGLVLGYMLLHVGRLVRRDELLTVLWDGDDDPPDVKVVDVHVYRIRKAIAGSGLSLESIWARGWILHAAPDLVARLLADPRNGAPGAS
jgi:hypothetical protein